MKILLIFLLAIICGHQCIAQEKNGIKKVITSNRISQYLIGQNAWASGEIYKVKDDVKAVHYQSIRIGGNGYENGGFMNEEVVKLIDYARSVGAEPIVQMPRQLKDDDKAFKAITLLNGKLGKKIKYWSIGNEPDHHNQLSSPEEVYGYFTRISAQIKRYDPHAKIIGFDLSSYKEKYFTRLLGGDLDVTGKIPGQNYHYLDIVSFHNYKFKDIMGFERDIKILKKLVEPINAQRSDEEKLGWAITEFNSHWLVDPNLGEDFLPYNFHNGQIFAEMYDLGMREGAFTICPWSILEGGADREGTDLGMFDLIGQKYFPRSNYYHTQMLAQHFRANYLSHSQTQTDVTVIPMGDESGVSVMILNKNKTKRFKFKLQLHLADEKNASKVIDIDANINTHLNLAIHASSTQMLIFNRKGKLVKKYTYSIGDEEKNRPPVVKEF